MIAVKINLPKTFQVGAIVVKFSSSWKCYRKEILHNSQYYSLEEIQKHLRIEKESRAQDGNEHSHEYFQNPCHRSTKQIQQVF